MASWKGQAWDGEDFFYVLALYISFFFSVGMDKATGAYIKSGVFLGGRGSCGCFLFFRFALLLFVPFQGNGWREGGRVTTFIRGWMDEGKGVGRSF